MKIKLFTILFLIIVLLVGSSYLIFTYPYSSGTRSGKLVKLSKKGIHYPTYEGILDLGSGDKLTWEFSIHDKKVGDALSKHSGKNIKLTYDELFFKILFETKYNVTEFEVQDLNPITKIDLRFCRLVNVMRRSLEVVNDIRENLIKFDPQLLEEVRKCQSN